MSSWAVYRTWTKIRTSPPPDDDVQTYRAPVAGTSRRTRPAAAAAAPRAIPWRGGVDGRNTRVDRVTNEYDCTIVINY